MSLLECHGLEKRYGSVLALTGINLTLEPGHIVGLLGPNGSGKSTFLKILTGLLQPTDGTVLIDGLAPGEGTKALVSYLPERNALPVWMTTAQAVRYYQDFFEDFRPEVANEMLQALGLKEKQRIRAMSKGTREKLQLILTMSRNARLYLLDEPIGGVDPATRDYILRTIINNYSESSTVVISTHLIADVEPILDDVIFLQYGQIVVHAPAEAIRQSKGTSVDGFFREVFRC